MRAAGGDFNRICRCLRAGAAPGLAGGSIEAVGCRERQEFPCAFGSGTLVTLGQVAGKTVKQEACVRFGALAVEMEATGVAAAAAELRQGICGDQGDLRRRGG